MASILYDLVRASKKLRGDDKFRHLDPFPVFERIFRTQSSTILKASDKVPADVQEDISKMGMLTLLTFGLMETQLLWNYREELTKKGGILEGYEAFEGLDLVATFTGKATSTQVCVWYYADKKELVISFSGTSNLTHAWQDLHILHKDFSLRSTLKRENQPPGAKSSAEAKLKYSSSQSQPEQSAPRKARKREPEPDETDGIAEVLAEASHEDTKGFDSVSLAASQMTDTTTFTPSETAREGIMVHAGFLSVYKDIEAMAIDELQKAFSGNLDIRTLSVIGHSLGAVMAFFLAMALLDNEVVNRDSKGDEFRLPEGLQMKVFAYGCPRIGPSKTKEYYHTLVKNFRKKSQDSFQEYSVRLFGDGESISNDC